MAKANKTSNAPKYKTQGKERKKFRVSLMAEEVRKLGIDTQLTQKDVSNEVRAKLGFEPLRATRAGKKAELATKLGLPENASNADIRKAMLAKLDDLA